MSRQTILHGLPIPVYSNETGTRQEILAGVYLDETAGAGAAALAATPTCVCTTVADLTTQITLAASPAGLCAVTADLSAGTPAALVASLTCIATTTSALTTSITLASGATCVCSITAVLNTLGIPLTASLAASSSVIARADLFNIGSTGTVYPPMSLPPIPHVSETNFSGAVWQKWMHGLSRKIRDPGQMGWEQLSFRGSRLTDIETRNHNDLQQVQGGAAGDYYHLTALEYRQLKSLILDTYNLRVNVAGVTTVFSTLQ